MASAPIYPDTIVSSVAQILPADTTTLKTLYTPGAGGSAILHIRVSSTDTVAKDVNLYVTVSGTDYLLFTLSIPANSGNTNALPSVSILDDSKMPNVTDINGNKILYLANGAVLKAKVTNTVTSTRAIQFFLQAGDF